MKKLFMIITVLITFFGCSEDQFVGSGQTISEFRPVENFDTVSSEGTFNVTITKGTEQSVEIIADNNIMGRVRTDVKNGKLKLSLADGSYRNVHLEAHLTVISLTEIENSGTGDIYVYNNTNIQNFKAFNSGTANIYLEGNCDGLDITNEGSGSIFAFNMPSKSCNIDNEGSGEIEVVCESNLDVKIEGSGNVYYRENPLMNVSISGSGQVIKDN